MPPDALWQDVEENKLCLSSRVICREVELFSPMCKKTVSEQNFFNVMKRILISSVLCAGGSAGSDRFWEEYPAVRSAAPHLHWRGNLHRRSSFQLHARANMEEGLWSVATGTHVQIQTDKLKLLVTEVNECLKKTKNYIKNGKKNDFLKIWLCFICLVLFW